MSKKVSRREFMFLSTAATVGALASACAPQATEAPPVEEPEEPPEEPEEEPEPEPEEEPEPEPEEEPEPEPEEMAWPREDTPRNRTFIEMFPGGAPEYANPGIHGCYATGFTHQHGDAAMLEPMAYFSIFGDKEYPWLAESYEYNEDATELTCYIRKGIEWSDGTPFTAADVEFTVQSLIDLAPDLRDSSSIAKWVSGVTAVDDYTVKLTFNEPN